MRQVLGASATAAGSAVVSANPVKQAGCSGSYYPGYLLSTD
ncbi:MAG: hypothetical protein ACLSH1_00450 [Clostridia bacterium]